MVQDRALSEIFTFIDYCNWYVQNKKPWETSQKLKVSGAIADDINRKNKKVLYTIIIAFAIICFWRGAWGIMDLYLFPGNHLASYLISILIGIIILYYTENLIETLI